MKSKRFFWLGLMAVGFFVLTACSASGGGGEICDDGIDNTGNGKTDCEDPDCANFPACQQTDSCQTVEDCDDPQCYDETVCQNICLTDCSHPACTDHANCQSSDVEICDNNIDDTGDGFTDCEAAECADHPSCQDEDDELSCRGINLCLNCCLNSTQECYDTCKAAGSETAAGQMDAFMACISTNCPEDCGEGGNQEDCDICLEENCPNQMEACDWAPQGTTNCMDLLGCLGDCPQNMPQGTGEPDACTTDSLVICYNGCFGGSDQDAIDKMLDFFDCRDENCGTPCQQGTQEECLQCLENSCSNELTACEND